MARKQTTVTIDTDDRDHGKKFVVTEMPALKGEAWAMRALLLIIGSNPNINLEPGFEKAGMAGMAEIGLKGLAALSYDQLEPLMAEMLECIEVMPDPVKPHVLRKLMPDIDIEEIGTLLRLRAEVMGMHFDFFKNAARSIFGQSQQAGGKSPQQNAQI